MTDWGISLQDAHLTDSEQEYFQGKWGIRTLEGLVSFLRTEGVMFEVMEDLGMDAAQFADTRQRFESQLPLQTLKHIDEQGKFTPFLGALFVESVECESECGECENPSESLETGTEDMDPSQAHESDVVETDDD